MSARGPAIRLRNPIWNRSEGRLRAAWRALLPPFVLVLGFAFLSIGIDRTVPPSFVPLVEQTLRLITAVTVLWGWARYIDKRRIVDYGLHLNRRWWLDLAVGAAVGILVPSAVLATLVVGGWATVTPASFDTRGFIVGLTVLVVSRVFVGVWEELVFRGILIKNLAEGFGGWARPVLAVTVALIGSTALFGALHLQQMPTATGFAFFVLLALALGLGYVLTGELAIPIGFHITYNLAAIVFGLGSDRITGYPTAIEVSTTGPVWIVGQAGVVELGGALMAVLAIVAWCLITGRRRPVGRLAVWQQREPSATE